MANKQTERCFLCGRTKVEVNQLVKGKFGYVCNDCIHEAYEVLNKEEEKEISHNVKLATPRQIKEHLDQYVVGQEDAKMTLSVAVYNHYKRLRQSKKSDVEIQKSNIFFYPDLKYSFS